MTQKAIVVEAPKQAVLTSNHPIPALRDDYMLVQTVAVAVNPTDWNHIDFLAPRGVLVGCDYAGIVEEVGPKVSKPFRKGDRVFGWAHGCNSVQPEDGAFAEHIVVKGDVQSHIPANLSFEEAAALGVGITTAAQCLYQRLGLQWPTQPLSEPVPILIYGGSTAMGGMAIQFAKLSGYVVYTTCSPRNFDLVKKLGADHVLDYHDADSSAKIRSMTNNKLGLALDTVANESSAKFCGDALSVDGGDYCSLLPVQVPRKNVNSSQALAYTIFGEPFDFGDSSIPAMPEEKAFLEEFLPVAERLLAEGKLRPHPLTVGAGGLRGVLDGLQRMREGKVSGEKLVYRVGET